MKDLEVKFDTNNIHSVVLNLLDGQVEIILRALELYGYNLDYMLNSNDSSDDTRQEKLALLKYTYLDIHKLLPLLFPFYLAYKYS